MPTRTRARRYQTWLLVAASACVFAAIFADWFVPSVSYTDRTLAGFVIIMALLWVFDEVIH